MIVMSKAKGNNKSAVRQLATTGDDHRQSQGRHKKQDNGHATVGGRNGFPTKDENPSDRKKFSWRIELGAAPNYRRLGRCLAESRGDLFRNHHDGQGLILVIAGGTSRLIIKGADLAPIIVDRVKMRVLKEGKLVRELPTGAHLQAMLRSESFLQQFLPLDEVAKEPKYLDDFTLAKRGYNDGGPGQRILYVGPEPEIAKSTATIDQFLNLMDFFSNADRTNTLAAALTVRLHRRWPGHKPVVVVTGTKSHSGKGTVTDFFCGAAVKAAILYEANDWPMQSQLQQQLHLNPQTAVVLFDNVRRDSAGGRAMLIRSAFIESLITSPEIVLASPGASGVLRMENRLVVTINTNDGRLSTDLLNRGLCIHLAPKGSVFDRVCPLGNPKLEFLPKNLARIEAELHGMIARWRAAGCKLDDSAKHPMSPWAKTIGGILKACGYTDFLANSADRKSADDPIQDALAILGAARPNKALRPREWARIAVTEGLAKTLFSPTERDTDKGRQRGIGVILSRHLDENFHLQTETQNLKLRLEGGSRRWVKGKNPHVRYRFQTLEVTKLRVDDEVPAVIAAMPDSAVPSDGGGLNSRKEMRRKPRKAK